MFCWSKRIFFSLRLSYQTTKSHFFFFYFSLQWKLKEAIFRQWSKCDCGNCNIKVTPHTCSIVRKWLIEILSVIYRTFFPILTRTCDSIFFQTWINPTATATTTNDKQFPFSVLCSYRILAVLCCHCCCVFFLSAFRLSIHCLYASALSPLALDSIDNIRLELTRKKKWLNERNQKKNKIIEWREKTNGAV